MVTVRSVLTLPRMRSTASFRLRPRTDSPSEMGDEVAGFDTGAMGRRLIDGRNHLHEAVLHGDFDAQTAELALGLDPHVTEGVRVQIAGMGIQGRQHALNGELDQLLIGHVFDIVAADPLEDIAEELQLPIGVGVAFLLPSQSVGITSSSGGDYGRELQFAHYPLALCSPSASHGSGLIGCPVCRSSKIELRVLAVLGVHCCHWLPGQYPLANHGTNPVKTRKEAMIAPAVVYDQDLAVGAEISRNKPLFRRRVRSPRRRHGCES